MVSFLRLASLVGFLGLVSSHMTNSTYLNPIIPGWHSDPSCVRVEETFYCVTSTFISFPGLPIYASKDLMNWKLVSHVFNRESQIPGARENTLGDQQRGMYAATIRHHDDHFYVVCDYLGLASGDIGVLFNTTDPYSDAAWSDPVTFSLPTIDPDLFWDDDDTLYVASQGIVLHTLDAATSQLSDGISIWNGTGGVWPEGPHIYKKDGWYYLLIAEGGTELDHSVTMARSRNITGPYEAYAGNPVLTNRGTDEYFQTVGHADLFQDSAGNWWGVALATRSGPEFEVYPMGRETVLFPVTWEDGEFPAASPVRGRMEGWGLPEPDHKLPGSGPFNLDPDDYDFPAGSELPRNLVYWRAPIEGAFTTTERGLQIVPSRNNLTGTPELNSTSGLSFVGRRQTDTTFTFTIDVTFSGSRPRYAGQEVGITAFLTEYNHIDLGLIAVPSNVTTGLQLALRFRTTTPDGADVPHVITLPRDWTVPVRLEINAINSTHYAFTARQIAKPFRKILAGVQSATVLSGGSGPFTGTLVGAYATCNGAGSGLACPEGGEAYVASWQYRGREEYIAVDEGVPTVDFNDRDETWIDDWAVKEGQKMLRG